MISVNLSPSGFIGCSVTFAIHLIAACFSRRPAASLVTTAVLGGALAVTYAPTPAPPAPPVPTYAYAQSLMSGK